MMIVVTIIFFIILFFGLRIMTGTPTIDKARCDFYDLYTGKIDVEKIQKERMNIPGTISIRTGKEGTMENKEKSPLLEGTIPSEIRFLTEELNFVQEKYISLCEYIEGEKILRAEGRQDVLSNEEFCDCLLQKNAIEEYLAILNRRLDRAFKKEGIE